MAAMGVGSCGRTLADSDAAQAHTRPYVRIRVVVTVTGHAVTVTGPATTLATTAYVLPACRGDRLWPGRPGVARPCRVTQ
jgi:hypothetical protein